MLGQMDGTIGEISDNYRERLVWQDVRNFLCFLRKLSLGWLVSGKNC